MLDANKLGALGAVISDEVGLALGDLSASAGAVLATLYFRPELTTTHLALVVGVSQPTAVRLIDGLQRQGLVTRGSPSGRNKPLSLTESGREQAMLFQRSRLAALDALLSPLEADERRLFTSLVDKILVGATTSRAWARHACRLCEHDLCGPGLCPIGRRAGDIERQEAEPW